jgi:hypothetical protein
VPQELSEEQQQAIEELSKTMGTANPRAGLFKNGTASPSGAATGSGAEGAGKGGDS